MTPTQEELVRALGRLRATHDAAWEHISEQIDRGLFLEGTTPEQVVDLHGRPALEAMQVALVNGYAALVTAEAQS